MIKRTVLFAVAVLVATVVQATDNGLPADFDPARFIIYGWVTDQPPSIPTAEPGDPKLENLTVMPGSREKEDPTLVLARGLSAGAAPTYTAALDSYREWIAQSNTDQGRLVEIGYATGFMSAVEVYGPKIRTVTIGEIADPFTRVCREHPEVPPQLAILGVIIEFQADKPTR